MGNIEKKVTQQILIAGSGTAAESVFVAADRTGDLSLLLGTLGVTVITGARGLCGGELGSYKETLTNSPLGDFLEGVREDGVYRQVIGAFNGRRRDKTIPLTEAGWIGDQIGLTTETLIRQSTGSKAITSEQASQIRLSGTREGLVFTDLRGGEELAQGRFLICATGAYEFYPKHLEAYSRKLILSGTVLKGTSLPEISELLRDKSGNREVAVLGSSHSSYAAVRVLRNHFEPDIGSLSIYGRSQPKRFFNSIAEAFESGYRDFDVVSDVCPVTGRVFRFGGNRGHASEETAASLDPLRPWSRFLKIEESFDEAEERLLKSDLVIAGLGYRPNLIPIINDEGSVIGPEVDRDGQIKVDGSGRIYFKGGKDLIPGAYALGLGAGIKPSGALGGEPGFKGRLDGVNVVWGIVGPAVLSDIIERSR